MTVYRSALLVVAMAVVCLSSCNRPEAAAKTQAAQDVTVGVVLVAYRPMMQDLTISSELVPFQQIDVYAKESGYVKQLLVDYGSRVKQGQLMAVLEIPELQAQLQERQAAIAAQNDEVARAQDEINRVRAQHAVTDLEYTRLAGVAKSKPGLVAQQEVDEAQGRDLASASQLEAAQGAYKAALGQLAMTKAQLARDQALYDYSRITAPFDGVVTQRYANLGALMQAGTSSNQATPLVRLSEESLYRLVIPVPETYVRYIRVGDPVEVRVPSLGKTFEGKVVRFSVDVTQATRTMHTEVDIPNPKHELIPGTYADAILTLDKNAHALAVPVQAVDRNGSADSVFVVDNDRIQERPVTLGTQTANYVEIDSGLRAGERVVVSERSGLRPGEAVIPHTVEAMAYEGSDSSSEQP